MKRWFAAFILVVMVCTGAIAAAKGPEVDLVDNKLSVNVEAIGLGRLLRLIDLATGMKSKVPPDLANRNISVKFSGLNVSDGVRKLFQGQTIDYVVLEGQGIIVTAASQSISGADSLPYNPASPVQPIDQFSPDFPPVGTMQMPGQQQPGMVQTPFGPIPNPRAQQAQPNMPFTSPGQQNSLFQQQLPNGQPQAIPATPGTQFANPNPFAPQSPFGTANPPPSNQNNGLFGSVPVFNAPGAQQR